MRRSRRALLLLALIPIIAAAVLVTRQFLSTPVVEAQAMDHTGSPGLAAMHAVCLSGDQDAMRAVMDAMTDEDWEAMGAHMQSSHGGMMGGGMMGSGMMGG